MKLTTFPWLLSNVTDKATGQPYAGSPVTHTMMWEGRKLGFVGLVESDWLATLGSVDPETIEHHDMVECGDRLAKQLRSEGCEFIIALTHSRLPNDEMLAAKCPELDMIFGGHDHDYVVKEVGGVWVVKSGTDFRDLTEIRASFPAPLEGEAAKGADGVFRPFPKGSVTIKTVRHPIVAALPEDPAMKAILAEYLDSREKAMKVPLGLCEVALDARFSQVRTRETNAGNLVADLLRKTMHGDVCLINGGTLRADRFQGPGEYTVKDLVDLLPMPTQCVMLEVVGSLFQSILENSVAKYPVLEGRFGQVSGMSFEFDPEQPAGQRVLKESIKVGGKPLDLEHRYKFVTTEYLSGGKDGYTAFADASVKTLVDHEEGPCIPAVIRNHFRLVNVASKMMGAGGPKTTSSKLPHRLLGALRKAKTAEEKEDGEQETLDIPTVAPKVEGRIVNIREKKVEVVVAAPSAAATAGVDAAALSLVFVLGGPGSGKGTNCERIAKEYGYKHLSTGDLLRAEVKSGSALGKELDAVMKTGGLVDSSMMLKILKGAMTEGNTKPVAGRYLIDGYPRAMDQIASFEAGICQPTFVLAFDAKEEVLEARLLNRGKASGRADDQNVEAIRARFKTFSEQSAPVITHYAAHGKVRSLNSERPVDEVYSDCIPLFRAELQRLGAQDEEKALPTASKAAARAKQARNIVFVLGAPGTGRGTQCENIAKEFGYKHLSTAYLLRAEVKSGSELGKEIDGLVKAGSLVSTSIVLRLLSEAMDKDGGSRFIIAGFPRAMDQVAQFEEQIGKSTLVMSFDAPEAVLEARILARGKANGRSEDNDVAVIKKRYATFKAQSEAVISHYAERGLATALDSNRPAEAVWADVQALFKPARTIVFVLGAPGTGRGTQCQKISSEFGYVNLSTSELLRAEVKSGSALGKQIDSLIQAGKMIDTGIVLSLLTEAMARSKKQRFVIAGFPRAMDQIEAFEKQIGKPTFVIAFDADEKVLEARLLARGKTSGRSDDQNVDVIRKRYATFKAQSEDVIRHYADKGIVSTFNSERSAEEVWHDVQPLFKVPRKIVFVLGAPGSGRGTQCENISHEFGYKHLSTAYLLRSEVKSGSELGKQIDTLVKSGGLVSAPLVLRLLKEAMEREGGNKFVIAGFPRALDQIATFEKAVCKPSFVINFDAKEKVLEERILARGKANGRVEDNDVAVIRKRYATYKAQSELVTAHYAKQGIVTNLNSEKNSSLVYADVRPLFRQTRNIVFVLGAPGSGRGTQSENIAKEFNYTHLSTAYLLRAEVKSGSTLGKQIDGLVKAGKLVDTPIVLRLLSEAMNKDGGNRFVIAGFPRAMDQVAQFEEAIGKPSLVLAFTASEAVLEQRVLGRGQANGRVEDQDVNVIRGRYATFKAQSEAVIAHYASRGLAATLNAERPKEAVWADVQALFKPARTVVFVLGAPGSGRGTQCERIAKEFGYANFSTSELLHEEAKSGSELGKKINGLIQAGQLVDTATVLELLKSAMDKSHKQRFIIAGFPRAMDQIEAFEKHIGKPTFVVAFDAKEHLLEERILARGKLNGRPEDNNVEVIRKRYATFKAQSEHVIAHYEAQGIATVLNAERSADAVWHDVQPLFKLPRKVVFVLGAPGSGRGTQCEMIAKEFGYKHLSTAYLLRSEVKSGSDLGKQVDSLIKSGGIVDAPLVLRLLVAAMEREGGNKFVIAGFPRAMDQIATFEKAVCKPTAVLAFDVKDEDILEKRILARGKANGRVEDQDVNVIRSRYATYKRQSEAVIKHYQAQNLVTTFDAARPVDAVFTDVRGVFKPARNIVFVLGAPGSGRGTQCENIAKEFGYKHLSTAYLLRAEVKSGSPLGKKINDLVQAGKLVDTQLVLRLVSDAMNKDGGSRFVIAGFPRAMDQVAQFEKQIGVPTLVMSFDAPEAVLEKRILARGKANGRKEDQDVTVIKKRYATFKEQSEDVIRHYAARGLATSLNADRAQEEVWADVQALFKPARNIMFVLGAPGTGRGTQCEKIAKEFGYVNLSTSELLHKEVASGSATGKKIDALIQAGKLVDTATVLGLLKAAMDKSHKHRFIIAGFPRAMDQIEAFEKQVGKPTFVVSFTGSEAVLEQRILARGKANGRKEDQDVAVIRKRYATFKAQSEDVIRHYAKQGIVSTFNSERSVEAVWTDVRPLFKLPRNIIFVLGAPGSGRGTQCENIAKEFGYKHLSTAYLLRAEVKSGSPLGKKIDGIIKSGGLVEAPLVLRLLIAAMEREGGHKFLIAGFPRAMDQIATFEKAVCKPTFVISFEAPEAVLEQRVLGRGKANGRKEDNDVAVIKARYQTFKAQSEPVIAHYAKQGLVTTYNVERSPDAVWADVEQLFPHTAPKKTASEDLSLVFVLGGPGSGKGTNCERIAKEYGYKHLSTGDLLRAEVKSGSALGKELDAVMKTGGLVDSSMMLKILKGAMTEGNTKPVAGRYLIDGYPRAMDQIASFEAGICQPTFVLAFDAKEEVLEARLLNRGKASGRADDQNVEAIRARFKTFSEQSAPVITHYAALGKVRKLNSERAVGAVYNDCKPFFDAELTRMGYRLPSQDLSLVFVLGGPGSGKGTNCERIAKEYGYKHLSTGDLLRAEVKSGSALGKELDAVMKTGGLVDSSMMLKILKGAMTEGNTKPVAGRYLIDGYPRAMDQIASFEAGICQPTFVLAFDAKEEVLEARLLNRGKASGRADDQNVEAIRARFKTFTEQSAPVIDHYSATPGMVRKLNSERPVGTVYNDCRPIFDAECVRMGQRTPSQDLSLVFVLGGPGSGKGTNCERIAKEYGYKHLSTGDLLRAEVKSGSALGKELDAVMKTGGLVDSSMMLKILKGAMTEGNTKPVAGRYLIDGYPRAMDQIASFEAGICQPTFVLAFDAKEEVLEARLLNRGKASGRADDQNVEAIRARFKTFSEQSAPVITNYDGHGIVRKINSERPVGEVYNDCKPLFDAELARMGLRTPSQDLSLVFVLGGPGSGKGTNCERIAKEYGYKHLSTGDLLRAEVKSGSALGKELDAVMKTGGLVDSSMMLKILKGAMTEGNTKPVAGRYLIDGYPRAMDQIASFEAGICQPTFVLAFDAKEEVLEARLLNRGKASGRADDQNVEAIRARFKTFSDQSAPVITHYAAKNMVRSLNSERPVSEVYNDVRPLFMAELRRMAGKAIATPKDLSLVFVLGGPGSGKGTNCERIAKEYGYKHLSTGDLLRAEVKSGSALGKELDAVMKTGGLVDSSMMLKILKGAMTEGNTKPVAGRYLIDGYPRAMDQIASFEAGICQPTFVLAFDAKEEVLEARLLNRGKASGRADDQNVEAIRARFKTFTDQSSPVIKVYGREGIVKALNSERPVDDVYNDCKPIFRAELARLAGGVAGSVAAIKTPAAGAASAAGTSSSSPSAASPSSESARKSAKVVPEGEAAAAPAGGCCTIA